MLGTGVLAPEIAYNAVFASLVSANLEDEIIYDCLSYTWGTEHSGQVVFLDEMPVQIGTNLHHALRRLQFPDQPRLVWVDFLCINQHDIQEKVAQIQIMFQIYHAARGVVVDLGDEADGSHQLAECMDRIWDKAHGKPVSLPRKDDPVWESFRRFLQRPWFRRVWVVQEVYAARRLQMRCGDWYMDGIAFLGIMDLGFTYKLPFLSVLGEDIRPCQDGLTLALNCLIFLMHLLGGKFGICNQPVKEWSVLELLETSRHHLSTDPRDRVFAFLNLCREAKEPALQADYSEAVGEIYTRVAKFFAVRGQLSRLLCSAGLSRSTLGLPSWIPDWSLDGIPVGDIALQSNLNPGAWGFTAGNPPTTSTSTETTRDVTFDDSCQGLKVTAFFIGRVAKLGIIHQYRDSLVPLALEEAEPELTKEPDTKAAATIKVPESTFRAAEAAVEKFTEEEWTHVPVLIRYTYEMLVQVRASGAYEDQDAVEVTCRTMVCDRQPGSLYRATPAEYVEFFKAYFTTCLTLLKGSSFSEFDFKQFVRDNSGEVDIASHSQKDIQAFHGPYLKSLSHRWRCGSRFKDSANWYCYDKRLGITEKGLVGLVPHRTELGDQLVVVAGVSVPMILRKVAGYEDRYVVVGQTFFHGLMYGEIFEAGHYDSEVITLV